MVRSNMDIIADVVLDERKGLLPHQMQNSVDISRAEIAHADDAMAPVLQRFGQMAAQKSRSAGD
jgi:hypothetical protein